MNVLIPQCCRCNADLDDGVKRFVMQVYYADGPRAMGAVKAHDGPLFLCSGCFRELNRLVNSWIEGTLREAAPPGPHFNRRESRLAEVLRR